MTKGAYAPFVLLLLQMQDDLTEIRKGDDCCDFFCHVRSGECFTGRAGIAENSCFSCIS